MEETTNTELEHHHHPISVVNVFPVRKSHSHSDIEQNPCIEHCEPHSHCCNDSHLHKHICDDNMYRNEKNDFSCFEHGRKPDLDDLVRQDNTASLSNFIRYGTYDSIRDHRYSKNKSMKDILLLSDMEIVTLTNFIQLCKKNKIILSGRNLSEKMDFIFDKFIATIQLSPLYLPLYYRINNENEELFYYKLFKGIYSWIVFYDSFCVEHGYFNLDVADLKDIDSFNTTLNNIGHKMRTYLTQIGLLFHIEPDKIENHEFEIKYSDKPEIKRNILHKKYHCKCEDRTVYTIPTIIKKDKSVISNSNLTELLSLLEDQDTVYLPKCNKEILSGSYKFENLNYIRIIGEDCDFYGNFLFEDCICIINNINFKVDSTLESPIKEFAIESDYKTKLRIEDCMFSDFDVAIKSIKEENFTELIVDDCLFNNVSQYGMQLDSLEKLTVKNSTFTNNSKNGTEEVSYSSILFTHNSRNNTDIYFHNCNFIANGNNLDSCALKLVNNYDEARLGISSACVEDCKFLSNHIDLVIGEGNNELTNVNIKYLNNIGLNNIKNNSLPLPVVEQPIEEEINNETEINNEIKN